MKTLVVFFSRSGNTRALARRIAVALDAELDEIVDRVDRSGIFGYLRSGTEASFHRRAPIVASEKDPGAFDLVVIGTPVWRVSLSSPVRAYLSDHAEDLPRVGFFCTMGGFGSRRVFRQMGRLCGQRPVATLARTERQLVSPDLPRAIDDFASRLRAAGEPRDSARAGGDGRAAVGAAMRTS